MNKTAIEWCDYTINPVKGLCPVACPYCYARRMYKRFKWNPEVRWDGIGLAHEIALLKKPSRIFVGSTMEMFGDWIELFWLQNIFDLAILYKSHTFIFLTKRPENLIKLNPFPKNVWVGVSAVDKLHFLAGCQYLSVIEAGVKFFSFEPFLESMESAQPIGQHLGNAGVNWLIIGRQTPLSYQTQPRVSDIQKVIDGANEIPIPVFLKNNLTSLLPFRQFRDGWKAVYSLRQEFPNA